MEVALILYMCSAIERTCLDPYVWPDRFYDKYGCMIEGYRESEKSSRRKIEKGLGRRCRKGVKKHLQFLKSNYYFSQYLFYNC